MTIRIVWRSDAHLADKPPRSRTDDWASTILDKLIQVGQIAREVRADAVIDGGDLFHIKSPSRNTHQLVRRATEVHANYPCPVYLTPGNHDLKYGSLEHLHETPLGVLFEAGVVRPLYDEHELVLGNVRVVGVPYHGPDYDSNRFTTITKGDEKWLIVAAHCLASPDGGTLFDKEDVLAYPALANLDPDLWCFLPGTQVIDWNGRAFPIDEVRESMSLAGRTTTTSVEEVHPVRQVDEEVVVLVVEGVPSDLIPGVTQGHPFWVAKGLKCRLPSRAARRCHPNKSSGSHPCSSCHNPPAVSPEWCPAGDIEPGDYMAVPVPHLVGGLSAPGLARLLGLYVAEGHVIENRNREPVSGVGWSFHEDETRLHENVRTLVKEHFDLKTYDYSGGTGRCLQVCAYGPAVAEFFLTHGGRHAEKKRLSSWVWDLSPASRLELLLGWLDGDGHARNPERYGRTKAEVMGATVSPQLATQMFRLALSVGLRPYYTIRPDREVTFPNGHTSEARPCHCISFYGENAVSLAARMGVEILRPSKTKVAGFFTEGLYWVRVREVSRTHYRGPVYNMKTSTEEYVAGLLLTHNCFGHWHKDQGVQKIADGKWAFNLGSLSRGALIQDDLERTPCCAVLTFGDTPQFDFEIRELKVRPAEEVFNIEGAERAKKRTMSVDAFATSLKETLVTQKQESLLDAARQADAPDEVRERAISYLEKAGAK